MWLVIVLCTPARSCSTSLSGLSHVLLLDACLIGRQISKRDFRPTPGGRRHHARRLSPNDAFRRRAMKIRTRLPGRKFAAFSVSPGGGRPSPARPDRRRHPELFPESARSFPGGPGGFPPYVQCVSLPSRLCPTNDHACP